MKDSGAPKASLAARWWLGYVVAIVATIVAALVRWVLGEAARDLPPYITFYPVPFVAALAGGTMPGLMATILSVLAGNVLFMEPVGKVGPATLGQTLAMALYIALNIAISILAGRLRAKSQALRESARRFRALETAGSYAVYRMSPDWTEMQALDGRNFIANTNAPIRNWLEKYIDPKDQPELLAAIHNAIRNKTVFESEHRVRRADGNMGWTFSRAVPVQDEDGEILEWVGTAGDVTSRKEAEEAVRLSEERFRTMANAIPQLAWIARPDGYRFWYNQRWLEYTGTTPQQMEGWGWQSVYDPQMVPEVLEEWRRALSDAAPFESEAPLRGADGRFRPFLTRVMPLKDLEGQVMLWFGTNTDITELRERERTLGRQARLIDLAPAATFVKRRDGTISFWSRGAEQLYGWSKEEAIGRNVHRLLHTEFPEPLESILAKVRAGHAWTGELRHVTRDSRQVIVQSYWLSELNAQGELEETLESNTDITERKRLQEHLEEAVEERTAKLREAIAELEHMSYSMIHDMRAPLRAMQGFAEMLEQECEGCRRPPASGYVQIIRESSNRLDRLITDALNYNKVVRQNLPMRPVDLAELLRGMVQTYPNLQSAEITVEFSELVVIANEALLTQCFGNLLDNAVKFVADGVKPRVRVWAEPSTIDDRPATSICVEDNGIGIPKEAQEKIFGMFQRMHVESEYPGTGIGLAIVRKAVERMNGRISIKSEPGKGTRFHIELPRPVETESNAPMKAAV
jgi:PAS domain S-box-containing protein